MIPEEDSLKVANEIRTQLEHKTHLIAVHKHGESENRLNLINTTMKRGRFTDYSHVPESPLYGSLMNMLIDLYNKEEIREEDYVRLVASIFSPKIPNWIPEITPRKK